MPKSSLEFMDMILEEGSVVSVITKIELLSFSASPKEHDSLKAFLEKSSVINLGEEIIEETISIRKKKKIKLPDAVIASTAKVLKLTLLTRNLADFKNIKNLQVLNPWEFTL